MDAAGIQHSIVWEVGCAYISAARATMLRKALDTKPDAVIFLDHDLSWRPRDLVSLIQADADVVAGLYRFKEPKLEYMGAVFTHEDGRPKCREDGLMYAEKVPAGFLKVTAKAVDWFMRKHPSLIYGPMWNPSVDLFNHGAHDGLWWGEDYAFSRNWRATGEPLFVLPDLDLTHWGKDGTPYPGNWHEYLLSCPGGSKEA